MAKKKKFKGQSKIKRDKIQVFTKMSKVVERFELSEKDLIPTPVVDLDKPIESPIVAVVDENGELGYVDGKSFNVNQITVKIPEGRFDRARPTVASPSPAGRVIDMWDGKYPKFSSLLTTAEIDRIIRDPNFENIRKLGREDPIFFAVRGEPDGTKIANSKGSLLLKNIHIKLGSKFDIRF